MTPQVAPRTDEDQPAFAIRAHAELLPFVRDFNARNQVVWSAWDSTRGDPDRYAARQRFAEPQYRFQPNVCHFAEHSTDSRDGQITFGPNELAEICRNLNRRIRDVALYSALADQHTDSEGKATPITIGWAGPHRIGMIGNEEPRFAIFGDEHYKAESLGEVAKRPRRSVELIRYRNSPGIGRSYYDPIACLGADSPRLPLPPAPNPITSDGETIRYSAVSPVYAGGSNTFIPTEKIRNGAIEAPSAVPTEQTMNDEMVKQLIDALMATPQMQFLTNLMNQQSSQPGQGGSVPNAEPAGGPSSPIAPPSATSAPSPTGGPVASSPMGGSSPAHSGIGSPVPSPTGHSSGHGMPHSPPPAAPADKDDRQYMANHHYANDPAIIEKYSVMESQMRSMLEAFEIIETENATLKRERTDARREAVLQKLASEFPSVNLQKELQKTLYSAGASISDDEFESRIELIRDYASQSAPPKTMAFDTDGVAPVSGVASKAELMQYRQKAAKKVVETITKRRNEGQRGPSVEYSEVLREVVKQDYGVEI